jgi:hypothetical protein
VTQNVYAAIILAAALLADDQLSGEAFWRRFSELAAAVDPVCREAKRDDDEKHQAYEATWQRVQATAQHRIDQLDPELKAPLRRRSSSSSHRPPAYPTNTDCWGFGRMVHCSTSKKAPPQEERAMHPVVSWLVVLGLFFAIWIVPAAWIGWIGSPREVLGWGVFIGGMTPVVLGVLDRIGRETKYENYTASKEKR